MEDELTVKIITLSSLLNGHLNYGRSLKMGKHPTP